MSVYDSSFDFEDLPSDFNTNSHLSQDFGFVQDDYYRRNESFPGTNIGTSAEQNSFGTESASSIQLHFCDSPNPTAVQLFSHESSNSYDQPFSQNNNGVSSNSYFPPLMLSNSSTLSTPLSSPYHPSPAFLYPPPRAFLSHPPPFPLHPLPPPPPPPPFLPSHPFLPLKSSFFSSPALKSSFHSFPSSQSSFLYPVSASSISNKQRSFMPKIRSSLPPKKKKKLYGSGNRIRDATELVLREELCTNLECFRFRPPHPARELFCCLKCRTRKGNVSKAESVTSADVVKIRRREQLEEWMGNRMIPLAEVEEYVELELV